MALGQIQFNHQDATTKAFITQAALQKKIYTEVRDTGVFQDMEVQKVEAPNQSMQDAKVQIAGNTGAIWTVQDPSGDEARFTLERNVGGEASYGDAPVRAGDRQAFLHCRVFLNEVDSELIPLPGRNQARRIKGMIPEFDSSTVRQITSWHKWQKDFDFHTALLEGSDYGTLLTPAVSGSDSLGKDLGLGAGVGAPPEHFYTPVAGATKVTIDSNGPRHANYKTAFIAALDDLADDTLYFNRQSINAIYQLAVDNKIDKVQGADWDYDYICDTAFMVSLINLADSDTSKSLISLMKHAQNGTGLNGQKTLDTRGAVVIDGIRIIPDRGMDKWRPKGTGTGGDGGLGDGVLVYGDGTRNRQHKTFTGANYKIGFGFLMGAGALLQAVGKGVEVIPVEDEFQKGKGYYGRLERGVRRGFWKSEDGTTLTATDGWLQQSVIGTAFNISTTRALT